MLYWFGISVLSVNVDSPVYDVLYFYTFEHTNTQIIPAQKYTFAVKD